MRGIVAVGCLALALACLNGHAEALALFQKKSAVEDGRDHVYLMDMGVRRVHSEPRSERHRPRRVYAVYDDRIGTFAYRLTDGNGEFAEPAEFLVSGTILDGHYLGAARGTRFLLTEDKRWVPTTRPSLVHAWVWEREPVWKTYRLGVPSATPAPVRTLSSRKP